MKKRMKRLAIIGVVLVLGLTALMTVGGFAVNPETVTLSATAAPTIQLTMTDTDVDWGGGQLAAGVAVSDSITAEVNSNKAWHLTVAKSGDLNNPTYGSIASSALTYGVTGGTGIESPQAAGTQFSTSATNVCGNPTPCLRGAGRIATINYTITPPWDMEAEAEYTASHEYTATQN